MDPNEALKRAREAARTVSEGGNLVSVETWHIAARDLAEAFHALDQWISKGGFLPDAWQVPARADFPPPKPAAREGAS